MEGWLEKKEKRNTWLQYWVVLQDMRLTFHQKEESRTNVIGWIELTAGTQCIVGKERKGRKCCFYVSVGGNKFLFRCHSEDLRKMWIAAIGRFMILRFVSGFFS